MSHIRRVSFCGLRRLNLFSSQEEDEFIDWYNNREHLEFGTVNIFIGANGGGKSTLIDLFRAITSPDVFVSISRENKKANQLTAFEVVFSDCSVLLGRSVSNFVQGVDVASNVSNDSVGDPDVQFLNLLAQGGDFSEHFAKNISKIKLDDASRQEVKRVFERLKCNIEYWTLQEVENIQSLARILNESAEFFPGILSSRSIIGGMNGYVDPDIDYKKENPFQVYKDGMIGVWLSDDILQQNLIHIDALPSGWKQFASIINWLECVPSGSICLIEEPETHIHPKLQRRLAKKINEIAVLNRLQIFISTHSTVFQQPNVWGDRASIFEVTSETVRPIGAAWSVLDALGIRGADISQSNGVIWVEGPSDRWYIKHWLKLWCNKYNKDVPVENADYSFSIYGGAMLSHFGVSEFDSFINLLAINRNGVVVIDRDLDFVTNEAGDLVCNRPGSTKDRVINELQRMGGEACHTWVTDGYTIESYLPENFRKEYFDWLDDRLVLKKGSKMAVAIDYANNFNKLKSCSSDLHKLEAHIAKLYAAISSWSC